MLKNIIILIYILVIFSLSGCKTMEPLTQEQQTISIIKTNEGKTKEELFEATKIWIAQNFVSANAVVEYENKENGTIIGNSNVDYPCSGLMCIGNNRKLHFSMRVDVKDDRYKISFINLEVSWPASYSSGISSPAGRRPLSNQGDYEEIKARLLLIAAELEVAMKNENVSSDW